MQWKGMKTVINHFGDYSILHDTIIVTGARYSVI